MFIKQHILESTLQPAKKKKHPKHAGLNFTVAAQRNLRVHCCRSRRSCSTLSCAGKAYRKAMDLPAKYRGGSGKLSLQPFQEMEWNLGWYGVWPLGLFPIWGAMMVMIVDVDGAPNVDVVAFYCIVNCESIFLNMFEMQLLITKPPRMIPRGWTWGRSENMRGSSTTFNSPYVVGGEMFCLQKWIDMAHLLYIPIFLGFLKNVWFLFPASFIIFPYTRPFGFRPPQTRSLEGSSGKGNRSSVAACSFSVQSLGPNSGADDRPI